MFCLLFDKYGRVLCVLDNKVGRDDDDLYVWDNANCVGAPGQLVALYGREVANVDCDQTKWVMVHQTDGKPRQHL